jgi:hypothetical protein
MMNPGYGICREEVFKLSEFSLKTSKNVRILETYTADLGFSVLQLVVLLGSSLNHTIGVIDTVVRKLDELQEKVLCDEQKHKSQVLQLPLAGPEILHESSTRRNWKPPSSDSEDLVSSNTVTRGPGDSSRKGGLLRGGALRSVCLRETLRAPDSICETLRE